MNHGLALAASGAALTALVGLALALLPGAPPPPAATPTRSVQAREQAPPSVYPEEVKADESPKATTDPGLGVTGEVTEGTLVVQLELGPEGVALLHQRLKPQLGFRLRTEGHHLAVARDARGVVARLRFAVPTRPSNPGLAHEVHGDELRVARPTVLLKLPALALPATLRVFDPQGTALGEVELR